MDSTDVSEVSITELVDANCNGIPARVPYSVSTSTKGSIPRSEAAISPGVRVVRGRLLAGDDVENGGPLSVAIELVDKPVGCDASKPRLLLEEGVGIRSEGSVVSKEALGTVPNVLVSDGLNELVLFLDTKLRR